MTATIWLIGRVLKSSPRAHHTIYCWHDSQRRSLLFDRLVNIVEFSPCFFGFYSDFRSDRIRPRKAFRPLYCRLRNTDYTILGQMPCEPIKL